MGVRCGLPGGWESAEVPGRNPRAGGTLRSLGVREGAEGLGGAEAPRGMLRPFGGVVGLWVGAEALGGVVGFWVGAKGPWGGCGAVGGC